MLKLMYWMADVQRKHYIIVFIELEIYISKV